MSKNLILSIVFLLSVTYSFAQNGSINNGNTNTVFSKYSFFIPNIFTPNGDGINDDFQGYGQNIDEYQMYIFDRWGGLLYQTKDYDKPWDGKDFSCNNVCSEGIYVYKFITKDVDGETHKYYGQITLLR